MRIVFIGAGNVATHMSQALQNNGHDVIQVWSRTEASARELAEKLGCEGTNELDALTDDADTYIISVSDAVLASLIPHVCRGRRQKLFLHTAGSMSMHLFKNEADSYGVLYPLQTFSKDCPVDFRQVPCFVEANNGKMQACVCELAKSISDNVSLLASEQRRYLHLAAVFACNFVNHCYSLACDVLDRQGIDFGVLLPLIDETARKVHGLTPRQAQTGPAVRYDQNVMERHLELLPDNGLERRVYALLSQSIHEMTTRNHD